MNILSTIVPVFVIIALGVFAQHRGFFSADFIIQTSHLVYYIGIPALIFSAISKADLTTQLNFPVILITLFSVSAITAIAWVTAGLFNLTGPSKGTFIQCSFHGNLGYIGLAVAFYYLDNNGFIKTAIIVGFVMILQNTLAVSILQYHSRVDTDRKNKKLATLKKTMTSPVILSALTGILFSLSNLSMPLILERSLDILKGMALPMALLIIGASLSFEKIKPYMLIVLTSGFFKLILAPAIGFLLFRLFSVNPKDYIPGLIIISSPSATITYIMAREIGGDPDLAVAAISMSTLISCISYSLWLSIG